MSVAVSESNSSRKRSQSSLDKYFVVTESVKKRRTGDETTLTYDDAAKTPDWSSINQNDMNISYAVIFTKEAAKRIFKKLESEIKYFSGSLAQV